MLTNKLERRYAKIRKELAKLTTRIKPLTPLQKGEGSRLEAELCDVARRLLMRGLAFAN